MPAKIKDSEMVGREFGRLTVVSREGEGDSWVCRCSCEDKLVSRNGKSLRRFQVKSCGCLQKENAQAQSVNNTGVARSHGMTDTKEYIAWRNMRARCDDVNHQAYQNYGGRGISYPSCWDKFEKFFEVMGYCPEGCSLDRLDVEKSYSAENCAWVTNTLQFQHRRKPKSGVSCQYKGVSFNKDCGKYRGALRYMGKYHHLGYSDDPLELALRYDELLVRLSGDWGGTNKELGLLMNVQ